jgi:hypothetical protein
MARHALIDQYVTNVAGRLPAEVVEELDDGLTETWERLCAAGLTLDEAARQAVTEFGTTDDVVDAFVAQASGRRAARQLLATGPVVGAVWGSALIANRFWTWPNAATLTLPVGILLIVAVLILAAAATARHSYRRTRLGQVGALAVLILDGALLVAISTVSPALVWPLVVAATVSAARVVLLLRLRVAVVS